MEETGEQKKQTRHRRNSSLSTLINNEEFKEAVVSDQYEKKLEVIFKRLTLLLDELSTDRDSDSATQSTKTQATISQLEPKYIKKYADLKKRVEDWKSNREELIKKLKSNIFRLDSTSKISTVLRLLASTIDASATTGSFWFPEHPWATPAAHVASGCAFLGLFCTVYEVDNSKRLLDDIYNCIEKDVQLLKPVVSWFEKETTELDMEILSIVPDGVADGILKEIKTDSSEENWCKEECLMMMRAALSSSVRKDESKIKDKDFLHSLRLFSQSDIALYWWNKILFRKHPIDLEYSRMSLEFGQLQSLVMKCIPTLPLEQQRLSSMPVAGRVILNALTMYDSLSELKKGAKSTYSDKLKKYVKKIETELIEIDKTFTDMEPKNGNQRPNHEPRRSTSV